ncbi:MAG: response regulator transcription factor [Chloroflexota bacterium]
MTDKITVLLVDDHAVVRQGVKLYLSLQPDIEVVGEAPSGEEAVKVAKLLLPDVILLDLIMPGGIDGVETTRRIKRIIPKTRIIVLTSYHEDEHIFPAIRAGALSYLLKNVAADELADAIRKAASNEAVLNAKVAARVIKELNGTRKDDVNPYSLLSDRELEVLQLIATGMSNADIAEQLTVAIKTVRSHVSNILSKLHLKDRTQAAVYAWREGVVRRHD